MRSRAPCPPSSSRAASPRAPSRSPTSSSPPSSPSSCPSGRPSPEQQVPAFLVVNGTSARRPRTRSPVATRTRPAPALARRLHPAAQYPGLLELRGDALLPLRQQGDDNQVHLGFDLASLKTAPSPLPIPASSARGSPHHLRQYGHRRTMGSASRRSTATSRASPSRKETRSSRARSRFERAPRAWPSAITCLRGADPGIAVTPGNGGTASGIRDHRPAAMEASVPLLQPSTPDKPAPAASERPRTRQEARHHPDPPEARSEKRSDYGGRSRSRGGNEVAITPSSRRGRGWGAMAAADQLTGGRRRIETGSARVTHCWSR